MEATIMGYIGDYIGFYNTRFRSTVYHTTTGSRKKHHTGIDLLHQAGSTFEGPTPSSPNLPGLVYNHHILWGVLWEESLFRPMGETMLIICVYILLSTSTRFLSNP